jgi:hypothetical protein
MLSQDLINELHEFELYQSADDESVSHLESEE